MPALKSVLHNHTTPGKKDPTPKMFMNNVDFTEFHEQTGELH